MPITFQTDNSILVVAPGNYDESLVRRRFELGDILISRIETLEEFDRHENCTFYEMIIVDQEILHGPTHFAMADLQMLAQRTSNLVIVKSHDHDWISTDTQSSAQIKPKSESTVSAEHLEIISNSVRKITHQNRNQLQKIQFRLEGLEQTLKSRDMDIHEFKLIQSEIKAIASLFETTRSICNHIDLDLVAESAAKQVEQIWREMAASHNGLKVEFALESGRLQWIDLNEFKSLLRNLFRYLIQNDPELIKIHGQCVTLNHRQFYQLIFKSNRTDDRDLSDLVELARARRVVLALNGHMELSNSTAGYTSCILSLPLV